MYAAFYELDELPFNITPDPRFLYLNDCYQEAIAALSYGIEARKGFLSLVGEAGTGKTTLLRRLLDTLEGDVRTVLLLNPTVSFDEILEHILQELGIPTDGKKLVLLQRLNEFLLEHTRAGGNVALLIDEAQDLDPGVLEELRLLSNLETAREKILQIVLAGQPELDQKLAAPGLRQLRQRITLRVRLRPLAPDEVRAYVRARLERAGARKPDLFTAEALVLIARLSDGIPRIVNALCDAALLTAFATGSERVTPTIVQETWRDYAPTTTVPVPTAEASVVTVAADLVRAAREEPLAAAPVAPPPPPAAEPVAAPLEAVPVEAASPAAEPAPPTARRTLSVPMAAAVIVALGVALYGLAPHEDDPLAAPPAPIAATPPAARAAAPALPAGAGVLSAAEAAALVEQFKNAYEARDVDRLLTLFAADAAENGHRGREAIEASYRRTFGALEQVSYTLASVSVAPRGERADVRAPFVISYRQPEGGGGTVRGQAEWELERRDGRPLIVALNYRLE